MADPYRILEVSRDASPATLKTAYRRLAKELHPDRNPGNAAAERRFKEVSQAYDLLSDPAKRAAFDRGEIDGEGRPRGFGGFGGGFGGGFKPGGFGGAGREPPFRGGFETIFEKAFGAGFGRASGRGGGQSPFEELLRGQQRGDRAGGSNRIRGADAHHRLEIDFMTAARGGRERLTLDDGRMLEVDVPPATREHQVLRLKGQGRPGMLGGPPGDALVEISVRPHPHFTRKGEDIHLELPVSLPEATLGTRVTVPTIDGPVRLTVQPGANSGHVLRLRGRGLARPGGGRGDQYVRLMVMLPEPADDDFARSLRAWAREHRYDVRRDLETA